MKKTLWATIITLASGVFILVSPLLTQQKPVNFLPPDCVNGKMQCGALVAPRDVREAIPLSASSKVKHRGLPSKFDLAPKMPPVGNQGPQGSCSAWATVYATKSYLESVRHKWGYDSPLNDKGEPIAESTSGDHVFSPAFTYNQLNGGKNQGTYIHDHMEVLVHKGGASWKSFPYRYDDFQRQPGQEVLKAAAKYRSWMYRRLDWQSPDPIKAEISSGRPVVVAIPVFKEVDGWEYKGEVYDQGTEPFRGYHAVAVVGYDDAKTSKNGHRGAFKFMNSWSPQWGDNGYGWMSYRFFGETNQEALVLYTAAENDQKPEPEEIKDEIKEDLKNVDAPARVQATKGSFADKIIVSWSPVSEAVAYEIQRAEPGSDEFQNIGDSNTMEFSDDMVMQDAAYKYRVVSIGGDKRSDAQKSPVAEGFAKPAKEQNPLPAQVVGVEASQASSGVVDLTWSPAAAAQSYEVARFDHNKTSWTTLAAAVGGTSFRDARPTADKENRYRVRGKAAAGPGEWSDTAVVEIGGSSTPPARPERLYASEGTFADKVTLKWDNVPGASTYYVFTYDYETEEALGPFEAKKNEYTDTSAAAKSGREMAYVVVAGNAAGYGEYSEPAVGYASPTLKRAGEVLAPPERVLSVVDAKKGSIRITWKQVKEAKEYYVYRKREKDKDFIFVKSLPGALVSYEEKIPGQPGEVFMYTVRTKSALGGESRNSKIVAGFLVRDRQMIRHRFDGDEGFQRFQGKWSARYWDGRSPKMQSIGLGVQNKGRTYTIAFTVDGSAPKTITGTYATKSELIESRGFRMQLGDEKAGSAAVDINNPVLFPKDIRLNFFMDKKP